MRFPAVPAGVRLGVGLDLPWDGAHGFVRDPVRGDHAADRVVRFLAAHAEAFSHVFVSFQPRNRNALDAAEYFPAFDDLFSRIPRTTRALHQTTLNLGALEPYDREGIIRLTNAFAERYGFAWVNEDLGLWSLAGRALPYPLPPVLTAASLRKTIDGTRAVQRELVVPLLVEFPGFSGDASVTVGSMHAYDFFRHVVEESGSACTLDVGHLLSYQWFLGKRGTALASDLERLPLSSCFEIHLSGAMLDGERFVDAHHGVLLAEQHELLGRLAPLCPNLRAVTYEDPRFDDEGRLLPDNHSSLERLWADVERLAA